MKDWDKQDDSDEELPNEGLQDVTDSDSNGGGWWSHNRNISNNAA